LKGLTESNFVSLKDLWKMFNFIMYKILACRNAVEVPLIGHDEIRQKGSFFIDFFMICSRSPSIHPVLMSS
jgi:hypothetical protein